MTDEWMTRQRDWRRLLHKPKNPDQLSAASFRPPDLSRHRPSPVPADSHQYVDSVYGNNVMDGATLSQTKSKKVPAIPAWSDKFVLGYHYGNFRTRFSGTYTGYPTAPRMFFGTVGWSSEPPVPIVPCLNVLAHQENP